MRARLAVVIAVVLVVTVAVSQAWASRVQVKGPAPIQYVGHDWVGKVSLTYSTYPVAGLVAFEFANSCSRSGSALDLSTVIKVGQNERFHYHGHGFTLDGNVIGSREHPREIAGLASVSSRGCHSGPWWFGVKQAPF
jgi:hypothetical protein